MFWQEETQAEQYQVPDDVVDLVFSIDCRELPVDHAHALSMAVITAAPWMAGEPRIGIHTLHVAGSQNGWERPEHDTEHRLLLSRRTKFSIRVPKELAERVQQDLCGRTLDIQGCAMTLGGARRKPLSKHTTLFARYVASLPGEDENRFLERSVRALAECGIRVRKALCGKTIALDTPQGKVWTRSLMVADLSVEEAVKLQQIGLGDHRQMGCGLFLPHKGIDAVHKQQED